MVMRTGGPGWREAEEGRQGEVGEWLSRHKALAGQNGYLPSWCAH